MKLVPCPRCFGHGCETCAHSGLLTEERWVAYYLERAKELLKSRSGGRVLEEMSRRADRELVRRAKKARRTVEQQYQAEIVREENPERYGPLIVVDECAGTYEDFPRWRRP